MKLTDSENILKLVNERVEAERVEYQKADSDRESSPFLSEKILKALNRNEDGDASLFIEVHQGLFCFDHAADRWYEWAGHFWREDTVDRATEGLNAVIDLYSEEAQRQAWNRVKTEKAGKSEQAKKDEATEDALLKRIRALQTRGRKENVLFLARTGTASLGITGEQWDLNPWLLGCLNGVIDLRTGEHRSGRPDDFIRTVAPTEWKGIDESAATWERFLDGIFDGDSGLIGFIQRLFGYCVTGQTTEHISPILWGRGRNGKGTLLETLGYVLGPYAGPLEGELILRQKFSKPSGGPSSDIMTLRGKRLVWCSETDEGRKLNAGKVKWLSGGDTLTGREVYGKRQTSFRPTHKLLLLTNHKPHANANDYALWKRIILIPFNLSFVNEPTLPNERQADTTLPDRLRAEASGILAWLVRGCLEWQRMELNPPVIVKDSIESYRQEEDVIGLFIEERCQTGPEFEIRAGDLYRAFKVWAEENGIRAVTGSSFGKEFKERFASAKNYKGVFYRGVSLSGP